ncbi:MAG: hypothetical protein SGI88_11345 [Candidatus Hydrogenedentes bacterium]|nr:hypothetical protein [Candidatus Hydrogenedentota bacterium]
MKSENPPVMFHHFDKHFAPSRLADASIVEVGSASNPGASRLSSVNQQLSYDFFVDLDAHTEYWDVYKPELAARYMDDVQVLFPGAVKLWFNAVRVEGTDEATVRFAELGTELEKGTTRAALMDLDALLRDLLYRHFPAPNEPEIDTANYLMVVEAFARDQFPDDTDRLNRLELDDPRRPEASRHRMNGTSMWFAWAAMIDCMALADGNEGLTPWRSVQLASCAFGSAMDFTFRTRGQTRPEYTADDATVALLRQQVGVWVNDVDEARRQVRDLYRVFVTTHEVARGRT